MQFQAMAGLAEAAEAFGVLIVIGAFCALGAVVFFAVRKRSKIAIGFGAFIWFGIGWLLQPWHAFERPQFPNDPDELYWMQVYHVLLGGWLVAGVVMGIAAKRLWKRQLRSPNRSTGIS